MKPYKNMGKQKYKYKKPIEIGIVIIWGIVIIVIASIIIALVWQKTQQGKPELVEEKVPTLSSVNNVDKVIVTKPVSDNMLVKSEESETANSISGIVYPKREEFSGSVLQKEVPVNSDYFDDALFIGDLVTAGIPTNLKGSYNVNGIIADKNISINDILEKKNFQSNNFKEATLLELLANTEKTGKIYIMLGYNDLSLEKEEFINSYSEFLDILKERSTGSIIYVQSILPNLDLGNNQRINEYNLLIMEMCSSKDVNYLDVAAVFSDTHGEMLANSAVSNNHITGEFYYRWFDYLKYHTN